MNKLLAVIHSERKVRRFLCQPGGTEPLADRICQRAWGRAKFADVGDGYSVLTSSSDDEMRRRARIGGRPQGTFSISHTGRCCVSLNTLGTEHPLFTRHGTISQRVLAVCLLSDYGLKSG